MLGNTFLCLLLCVHNTLLPPIRVAEIVKCVRKYMDGSSKSAKLEFLLTRSYRGVFALTDYG